LLLIRLCRRPRLRAETPAWIKSVREERHFGVQARACSRGSMKQIGQISGFSKIPKFLRRIP
jgi:hypothetical protein